METIIRNVRDIESSDRLALEHVLGRQLHENHQLIIEVMTVEPGIDDGKQEVCESGPFPPNNALLKALCEIDAIQKGMNPIQDDDTLRYLKEARAGAMYGYDPNQ